MSTLPNVSYIFIPFTYSDQADFRRVVAALDRSELFCPVHDEIRYMLKYVADKIDSRDKKNCQCFHYLLNEQGREHSGIGRDTQWYCTKPHRFGGEKVSFRFKLLNVHLYCFSTSVGILSFQIHHEHNDPFWISNALYYLKKVSKETIRLEEETTETTLLALANAVVGDLNSVSRLTFFYYANPSTERANILTYLEVGKKENYKEELFFLRRCYSEGFLYTENPWIDDKEVFSLSKDIVWGVSPEAAVCLACVELGRKDFIRGRFYLNFNDQYLFMYVLLLHQKYVLYMFLTQIGIGTYNNLEMLEKYRHQLYEFETDFVFSCVTEVTQYQTLYDRMTEAFALRKMYEDVHDPLISLAEVRREVADSAQKKRDRSVDKALLMLAILSFFSALVDSFDFIDSFFGWFLPPLGVKIAQVLCIAVVVYVVVLAFRNLMSSKGEKMAHSFTYVGCFVGREELKKAVSGLPLHELDRVIESPHVTFAYMPEHVDRSLFGERVGITIVGYGNDGENEGLKVKLTSGNPEIQKLIDRCEVPHITLSVSESGKSVNTKNLLFSDVDPVKLTGTVGGYTKSGRVVLSKRKKNPWFRFWDSVQT